MFEKWAARGIMIAEEVQSRAKSRPASLREDYTGTYGLGSKCRQRRRFLFGAHGIMIALYGDHNTMA